MLSRYRRSLSLQLIFTLVAACLVVSGALAGLTFWSLRSNALEDLSRNTMQARDRAAQTLETIRLRMLGHADVMAQNPALAAAAARGDAAELRTRLTRLFEEVRRTDPSVSALEVTNDKGVILMRGHRPAQFGDNKSSDPLFRDALKGGRSNGYSVSPTSGEVAAEGVVPLFHDGVQVGTVKVGAYLRADTAAELKSASGSEIIMTRGGKVNVSTIPGIEAVPAASGTGAETIDLGGSRYSTARASIRTTGSDDVQVVSLTDVRPAMDEISRFTLAFLGQASLALLLLLPAVIVLMRRLAAVIQDVTASMSKIAEGHLDSEVRHSERQDEVGAMARAVAVFRENGLRVRDLEAKERAAAAERAARTEAMIATVQDVGQVVAAAAAGDFSARLQVQTDDPQMARLVDGVNQINAVVDSATADFAAVLERISQGDLTQPVAAEYRGRFADLKRAINTTIERLSQTVGTVQVAAVDVASAAREINAGANDLSRRTEGQAASLEETAATTEQLAASVKASAQSSRKALELAEEAMKVAESGGSIVGQAVDAMARIEQASQKISDITTVIDEIAFQTNLLALNAAVEAARAGDAGKGFAVVASEVRTLAQRSSEAAKDITGLIQASGTEVVQGVRLVREAGDALTKIVSASHHVAATVGEIASATAEQANGIDEMSQVVAQMDQTTQQNAALAEESAASATSLSVQIDRLNEAVAIFRTRENAGGGLAASHRSVEPGSGSGPARLRGMAEAAFAAAGRPGSPRRAAR
ncbi:methyl-accepting chemotaxis protein [Alsobacter sp. R-9]